ncbi:MAG: Lrp/AsnC family transcriptional regulator [Sporomusaceae bacterium]|nr:Lrp/AsnC family transcriptional regulator [Sporomusaceae bacterium]
MLDHTDLQILNLLKENSRMQYRDIGDLVHLTGQAVSNRVARMEKLGVIKGYSILLDEKLLGKSLLAYITVFMKTTEHGLFQSFLQEQEFVTEACRISGEGCYMLRVETQSAEELDRLLDSLLPYGNYRINLSIKKIK